MMKSRRAILKRIAYLSGGLLAVGVPTSCMPQAGQTPDRQPPSPISTMHMNYEILATGLDFPEGPAFDPQGNLWFTELLGGNIVRYDGGKLTRIPVGGSAGGRGNSMAFDKQGRAWVTDSGRNAIQRFDPSSETWEVVLDRVDGQTLLAPNDLCFDAAGNLIFSCPNYASEDPTGYVVCLSPDGQAKKIVEGYHRPNGLDVIDGGKSLVVADTYRKAIFKGKWDADTRVWNAPRVWAQVGGSEGPDGMVPGADGFLYQAIYGDGVIRVIDAQGKVQQEIKVPGQNPTNAAIDPTGQLGLVVTETEKGQLISFPGLQPGVAIFS